MSEVDRLAGRVLLITGGMEGRLKEFDLPRIKKLRDAGGPDVVGEFEDGLESLRAARRKLREAGVKDPFGGP